MVDVETTGLHAARDRILEIAVIHTDEAGRIVDQWATLINPSGPVGATGIHGITDADVRRAPRFADVIGEVNARLAGRALVAHNAVFDLAFLAGEFRRAGYQMPTAPHLCTLDASRSYLPKLARRRLSDCCWAAQIPLLDAHTALADAQATAALLRYYLDPRIGLAPLAEHRFLPAQAATTTWQPIPRTDFTPVGRPVRSPVVPAKPGALAALLDDLPLSAAVEEGAPAGATTYLEMLAGSP